jgi:hypothetical protein
VAGEDFGAISGHSIDNVTFGFISEHSTCMPVAAVPMANLTSIPSSHVGDNLQVPAKLLPVVVGQDTPVPQRLARRSGQSQSLSVSTPVKL